VEILVKHNSRYIGHCIDRFGDDVCIMFDTRGVPVNDIGSQLEREVPPPFIPLKGFISMFKDSSNAYHSCYVEGKLDLHTDIIIDLSTLTEANFVKVDE